MAGFKARVVNKKTQRLADGRNVSGWGCDVGEIIKVEVIDHEHEKRGMLRVDSVIGELLWIEAKGNYIGSDNIQKITVDLEEVEEL